MPPPANGASISAPGGLTFGESFQFDYTAPDDYTDVLAAETRCSRNGERVYGSKKTLPATFTLGPTPKWSGGAATCTVDLRGVQKNGKPGVFASNTYEVGG